MSGTQLAQGLLEHDGGPAARPRHSSVSAVATAVNKQHHHFAGNVVGGGVVEVEEEVEDFLDKLVADVVDKVDEAPSTAAAAAAGPVKVGVVHDEDMENLRDLLDDLLDDNSQDHQHGIGHHDLQLQQQQEQLSPFEEAAADVCQQTGAEPQLDPTEGEATASALLLAGGGEAGAGGAAAAPQRPPRPDEELAAAAPIDVAAAAASSPRAARAAPLSALHDDGGLVGLVRGRQRRTKRKSRTASRTRRRKQRTARSRSTRSSRSRSSRSRDADDSRSRSRHKRSRKHKRHRRHHHHDAKGREPLLLSVDQSADTAGPVSPRVNPVFLWVKQEECRILSVVCEDYDRRNRITLTKTTNGWRAIPKTERFSAVLGPKRPSLEDDAKSHTASSAEGDVEEDDDEEEEEEDMESDVARPEVLDEASEPEEGAAEQTAETHGEGVEGEDSSHRSDENVEGELSKDEEVEHEDMAVMDGKGSEGEKDKQGEEGECGTRREEKEEGEEREKGAEYEPVRNVEEEAEVLQEVENCGSAAGDGNGSESERDAKDDGEDKDAEGGDGAADDQPERGALESAPGADPRHESPSPSPLSLVAKDTGADQDRGGADDSDEDGVEDGADDGVDGVDDVDGGDNGVEDGVDVPTKDEDGEFMLDEMCKEAVATMEEACKKMQEEMLSCAEEAVLPAPAGCKSEEEAAEEQDQPMELTKTERRGSEAGSRPCSVYDLLSLDETDHVVRLPADLEVSLVRGTPSPALQARPQSSPSPSRSVPPPHCSPEPALRLGAATTITPLSEPPKQQHKFLESLLNSPRKSDLEQDAPLDLGVPVRQPKDRPDRPEKQERLERLERPPAADAPPAKKPKLDDLTLRNLLNRLPGATAMSPVDGDPPKDAVLEQQADVKRIKHKRPSQDSSSGSSKSRLMELLTVADMDPLAQLNQVLSDLHVPDPLLVPRARLQALVTSPAQEIPRLLAQKHESRVPTAATPSGLDPDVCVVPLSQLQTLLQPEAKQALAVEEYQRQLLEAQMLWLPYLEAAYSYPGGYLPGYDYKSQMELQNALAAAWQETMLKGNCGTGLDALINNNNNYKKASPASPQPPPAKVARKTPSPVVHTATPRHLSAAYADKPAANKYAPSLEALGLGMTSPAGPGFVKPAPPSPRSRPVPAALPLNNNNVVFAAPQRPYQYQQQQQQRREYEKQQQQQRREYEKQLQQQQRREYEKQQQQQQQRREYEKQQQQQQQQQRREYEKQQRKEYEKQQEYHQQLILLQQLQLQQQILAQQQQQQQQQQAAFSMLRSNKHGADQPERPRKSEGSRPPTCKSLLNLLSAQREAQQRDQAVKQRTPSPAAAESALLAALGTSPLHGYPSPGHRGPLLSPAPPPAPAAPPAASPAASPAPPPPPPPAATAAAALPGAPVLDLSGSRRPSGEQSSPSLAEGGERKPSQGAKLKIRNLVDPNAKPRLLKLDTPVVPPPAAPPDDVPAQPLWHPLYGSQKSYNSPWTWTTVTVNGE